MNLIWTAPASPGFGDDDHVYHVCHECVEVKNDRRYSMVKKMVPTEESHVRTAGDRFMNTLLC
jgi:hypothetical protein